jgi:translation initiation factor IF-2
VIDTPGQIEAFSQSASGQIITESLACSFPTVNLYLADTVRCENPNTFTSNMLYSLSILYKSKLPMVICFNKNDVLDHSFALEWMRDFDRLDQNLSKVDTYLSSLSRSLSLVLEEFYRNVEACGVSAVTGKGFEALVGVKVPRARKEYFEVYYKEMEARIKEAEKRQQEAMSAFEGAVK